MRTRREVWLHLMGHAMAGMFAKQEWTRDAGRQQIVTEAARSADEALELFEVRFGHVPYDGPFTLSNK